jgi:hypothetical protein
MTAEFEPKRKIIDPCVEYGSDYEKGLKEGLESAARDIINATIEGELGQIINLVKITHEMKVETLSLLENVIVIAPNEEDPVRQELIIGDKVFVVVMYSCSPHGLPTVQFNIVSIDNGRPTEIDYSLEDFPIILLPIREGIPFPNYGHFLGSFFNENLVPGERYKIECSAKL